MDLRAIATQATAEERAAVDALLGPPSSAWDGGERGSLVDAHVAHHGGRESRAKRNHLLPALEALQARVGWISEGGMGYVCTRLDVPPADAWAVATFYALLATTPRPRRVLHVCDDIACRTRGAKELCALLEKDCGPAVAHAPHGDHVALDRDKPAWMHSPCLGLCDQAPAALVIEAGAHVAEKQIAPIRTEVALHVMKGSPLSALAARKHVTGASKAAGAVGLLDRVGPVDPERIDAYKAAGGFTALPKAFDLGPEGVIREMTASKIVGRGGAAFPTGRKWDAVRSQQATPHYLVCNADESEPGTFKDRALMAGDPFAIVEAMTIAAFATGCEKGFIYIRGEYPLETERLRNAIGQSQLHGYLGDNILKRGLKFDIEIRRGAGAYICGEETAIFESIAGRRGEPRNKPPFPVQVGLFGKPTVVNNVETLANVLPIILKGGEAFAKVGTAQSPGTRLFCVSGSVGAPGVYEVVMGSTLRGLIDLAGGVTKGAKVSAVLMGGAAGTFLRADELDLKLTHEDTRAAGTTLGSGVVMVFDDKVDLRDIVVRIASFFRDESCGQCVPCRVGTVRQEEALLRLAKNKPLGSGNRELGLLDEIGAAMKDGSICGLGQTAYSAVESAIKHLRLFDGATA